MSLSLKDTFPHPFVTLNTATGFGVVANLARSNVTTINGTLLATLDYLLPLENWTLSWTSLVNEAVAPCDRLSIPTHSLTFGYASTNATTNARPGTYTIANSTAVNGTAIQPSMQFRVSDASINSGNSEVDSILVSIGEGITLSAKLFLPQGTSFAQLRVFHPFNNGASGLLRLSGKLDSFSDYLTGASLIADSAGVASVVGGLDGVNNFVDFDLGYVVNTGFKAAAAAQEIDVSVNVLPVNDTRNVLGTTFNITAQFNYGCNTTSVVIPGVIQEQFLRYTWTCSPEKSWTVEAGDRIRCNATVSHSISSTSAAFAVIFSDRTLIPEFEVVNNSVISDLNVTVSYPILSTGQVGVRVALDTLALQQKWSFSVVYQMTPSVRPLSSFSLLTARLAYSSYASPNRLRYALHSLLIA